MREAGNVVTLSVACRDPRVGGIAAVNPGASVGYAGSGSVVLFSPCCLIVARIPPRVCSLVGGYLCTCSAVLRLVDALCDSSARCQSLLVAILRGPCYCDVAGLPASCGGGRIACLPGVGSTCAAVLRHRGPGFRASGASFNVPLEAEAPGAQPRQRNHRGYG